MYSNTSGLDRCKYFASYLDALSFERSDLRELVIPVKAKVSWRAGSTKPARHKRREDVKDRIQYPLTDCDLHFNAHEK